MRARRQIFTLALLASSLLSAQDFTHLHLDLELDTAHQKVLGKVQHRITDLEKDDTLFLNGIRMDYEKVRWNGDYAQFFARDTGLFVIARPPVQDTNLLEITYSAKPRKGLYFIGYEDQSYRAPRQIWTQGQGIDHRHWIPHRDDQRDKVIFSLSLLFDSSFTAVSNGTLDSTQIQDGQKKWFYSMEKPMSSYLIALMIAHYDSSRTFSASGLPLTQFYYPSRAEDYEYYYQHNEKIFDLLSDTIPYPYPWQNYKQAPVRDFRHGAMENTTATLFGDFFLVDSIAYQDRNYTAVNAHELAHQWFGNLVTATGSEHHWLHEGFATYYQWLSEGVLRGEDFLAWERHEAALQVFAASAENDYPLAHPQAGSARFYQKGAWVLHMLQQKIGSAAFQAGLEQYLQKHAYGLATTDSLRLAMQAACQCDLKVFFDQWVHRPGEPVIQLREAESAEALKVNVRVDPPTTLDFRIHVVYRDDKPADTLLFQWKDISTREIFTLSEQPDNVQYWEVLNAPDILANWRIFKSLDKWQNQWVASQSLLNRHRSVAAMENFSQARSQPFLEGVLSDKKAHHGARGAALKLLLERPIDSAQRQQYLLLGLRSQDVELQKTAVQQVDSPGTEVLEELAQLRRHGNSYRLRAAAVLRSVQMDQPEANRWLFDEYFEKYPGFPDHEVHLNTLLFRLLIFRDREAFEQMADYSSPAFDFQTRLLAIEYLGALKIADEDLVENLFRALFNPNWKLRKAARGALRTIYESPNKDLIDSYRKRKERHWEDFQKRRVERTFEDLSP